MILVIPMAGRGSRYSNRGYEVPKPLIEIKGKPMLFYAYGSVSKVTCRKVIFIALKEHQEKYGLENIIKQHVRNDFELILLDDVTEGQLCTVLTARSHFREGEGILIAASDSYVVSNIEEDIKAAAENCEGLISVINMPGENWSFAKTEASGRVVEVAEKSRISDHASTGLYYFSDARLFGQEADALIKDKETTKGEYYIMPLYNRYIKKGKDIRISQASEMWDMGTPEAKEAFENYLNKTENEI